MIGRFIEQENIGVKQHGDGEFELHLPTTGQRIDDLGVHFRGEADGLERRNSFFFVSVGEPRIVEDEIENRVFNTGTLQFEGDVDSMDFFGRGKTVGDGYRESSFYRIRRRDRISFHDSNGACRCSKGPYHRNLN